tara:strand:+ start:1080 stop:1289 length:210 start_codon:yes stop_codon:yes gene_type:complete
MLSWFRRNPWNRFQVLWMTFYEYGGYQGRVLVGIGTLSETDNLWYYSHRVLNLGRLRFVFNYGAVNYGG